MHNTSKTIVSENKYQGGEIQKNKQNGTEVEESKQNGAHESAEPSQTMNRRRLKYMHLWNGGDQLEMSWKYPFKRGRW